MKYLNKIRLFFNQEKGVVNKKTIRKYIGRDAIIIEAGAHIGTDTCEMAKLWPDTTIYAFEPIPELFEILKHNTSSYSNVKCFQLALGNKTGITSINKSSGDSDASSSLLEPKEHLKIHPTVLFDKKIEIEVTTLSDWMKLYCIERIDFLWLDLQGFELDVLKDSVDIVSNVSVIYTEVSLIENYSKSALYPELRDWLMTLGFKVKIEKLAWMDGGNVLFVKK
jgi:2-O-methyltransferase